MTWETMLGLLTLSDMSLGGASLGGVSIGAGVLALGVLAGVMPLRGGGGQHAGSGPGALNVWQLCGEREEREPDWPTEDPVWPTEDADAWLTWMDEVLPRRLPGSERMLEPFELCEPPGGEVEYVGRHRLVNPLEHLRLDIVFQPP